MSKFVIEVPDQLVETLGLDGEHAVDEMRLALAMRYYDQRRLSTGAAAEFAGVPVPVFLSRLAEFGISALRLSAEDIDAEVAMLERIRAHG